MKFAVVILACVATVSAQLNTGKYNPNPFKPYDPYNPFAKNKYQPTTIRNYTPFAYPSSTIAPVKYVDPIVKPAVKYQGDARSAQTLKYGNDVSPDGSYNYFFETDNGIAAQAQGSPRSFAGNPPVAPSVAQGSFSWFAPDGQAIQIAYVADENGYQPTGNAIPTSPPLPPQIARALEYIAKNYPQQ